MFYEIDSIEDKLTCTSCSLRYDLPKILACGNTICSRCERKMLDNVNQEEYVCLVCHDRHTLASNGSLPINKTIKELLLLLPTKVYRGQLHQEANASLLKLKSNIFDLKMKLNNSQTIIDNYCDGLIKEIDDFTDSRIMLLNKQRNCLVKQVNNYRCLCIENVKNEREEVADLIGKCENVYNDCDNDLQNAQINEHVIDNILKRSIFAKRALHNAKSNIYFYKKQLKFHRNEKPIVLSDVGMLQYRGIEESLRNCSRIAFRTSSKSVNMIKDTLFGAVTFFVARIFNIK